MEIIRAFSCKVCYDKLNDSKGGLRSPFLFPKGSERCMKKSWLLPAAAVIGGVNGTATVSAGQYFNIPVSGTMAHSWVMYYKDELTAFRKFAEVYPDNCILLVDTYDVLDLGVPNAIKVFQEMKDKGIKSRITASASTPATLPT